MKSIAAIIFIFLCSVSMGYGQDFALGGVTKEELLQSSHPADSTAVAAVLFESGKASFEVSTMEMRFVVKRRIKIYRKEGYDWANLKIPALTKSPVNISDAVTYNLENGQIVETKLQKTGIFDEKVSKFLKVKSMTMPGVKEGSVIEYQYEISSPLYAFPDTWNFQSEIPVNYSEYATIIPKEVISQPVTRGRTYARTTTESFQRGQEAFIKTTSVATNVPALKPEPFVNNMDNYRSGISHDWIGFEGAYGYIKYFNYTWPYIIGRIYRHDDFAPELKKRGYFEKDLDPLLVGKTTEEEKIEVVLDFVKSAVKWNGLYGYACDKGVRSAYKTKDGNVADINLMLTAMLQHAGLKAHPVVLSTRGNGVPALPRESSFDYVIAAVEINDKRILLDATEKYSMPDVLPVRCINWVGRIIRDETFDIVRLAPEQSSREAVNIMVDIDPAGVLNGKLKKQFTAHLALDFRLENSNTTEDQYLQDLESNYNGIEINNYIRENTENLNKPVLESYEFRDSKSIEVIGDKIYVRPMLFLSKDASPFTSSTREFPVEFGYKFENRYNISIEIPNGYDVESLPGIQMAEAEEKLGSFRYNTARNGNKIQLNIIFAIDKDMIPAEQYPILQTLYHELIRKGKERIVLIKK